MLVVMGNHRSTTATITTTSRNYYRISSAQNFTIQCLTTNRTYFNMEVIITTIIRKITLIKTTTTSITTRKGKGSQTSGGCRCSIIHFVYFAVL